MPSPANSLSVATGSRVVTGVLTSFVAAPFDMLIIGGVSALIASCDSTTQLTLKRPWPGASIVDATAWDIVATAPYWQSSTTTNKQLNSLLQKFEVGPVKWDASGTLAGRAAYNNQGKDFVYLSVDTTPFTLYVKLANTNSASDWSAGQPLALKADSTAAAEAARDLAQASAGAATNNAAVATSAAADASGSASTASGAASTATSKAVAAASSAALADGAVASASKRVATVASATSSAIPASTQFILAEGYTTPRDGRGGRYRRVDSAPGHPLAFRTADRFLSTGATDNANGGYWEIVETTADVRMAGAAMDSATDDSAALLRAWNYVGWFAQGSGPGATNGPIGLPTLFIPAGNVRAPGVTLDWFVTDYTIFGQGNTSKLDGVQLTARAKDFSIHDLKLIDSRGMQPGTRGIVVGQPLTGQAVNKSLISNVFIRDKEVGLELNGVRAYDNILGVVCEKNQVSLRVTYTQGAHLTNCEFLNTFGDNLDLRVGNEAKFSNCRAMGAVGYNCRISGSTLEPWLEGYFGMMTLTVAQRTRLMPVLSVADNGSGFARITTSAVRSVQSFAALGNIFTKGAAGLAAGAFITITAGSAGAQLSTLTAAGVALISSAVAWQGTVVATAAAITAAINAGTATHGYTATAPQNNGRFFISAPVADGAAANGRLLALTQSGLTLGQNAYLTVTVDADHGYTTGQDVEFACGTNYNGMAEVSAVLSSTTFAIEAPYLGAATGTCWTPNRLVVGLNDLRITGTGLYDGTVLVTGCTGSTVDINRAYAGNATGSMNLPNWDLVIEADGLAARTSDVFFNGGNINYTLIRSGFRSDFIGTRTKTQFWCDKRLNAAYGSNRQFRVGGIRGLGSSSSNYMDTPVSGGATGWGELVYGDESNSYVPGSGFVSMRVPHRAGGTVNGKAAYLNGVWAYEDRVEVRAGSYTFTFRETGVDFGTATSVTLPGGHKAQAGTGTASIISLLSAAAGAKARIVQSGDATGLQIEAQGNSLDLYVGSARQVRVLNVTSAVTSIFLQGAATGGSPIIGVNGEATADLLIGAGTSGAVTLQSPLKKKSATFGTLPAASASQGREYYLTDRSYRSVRSDGGNWKYEDGTTAT